MRANRIWVSTFAIAMAMLIAGCNSATTDDESTNQQTSTPKPDTTKPSDAAVPKKVAANGNKNDSTNEKPVDPPKKTDSDSSTAVAGNGSKNSQKNTETAKPAPEPKKPAPEPKKIAKKETPKPLPPQGPRPVSIDSEATEIVALDVNGATVKLSNYRGKVVLLDFWAVWCGPCIRELPNVKEVYAKHKDKNFDILGVSLDTSKDRLQQFVAENEMPWRQVFDGKGWKNSTAVLYDVHSIPRMYLIDEDGIVRYQNVRGAALHTAVDAMVEKGLARLATLVKSEDVNIKSLAAFRMGKYGAPNAKETLTGLIKGQPQLVQRRAAVGLAWLDDSSQALLPQIREAANDDVAEIRAASLKVLAREGDSELLSLASNALLDEEVEVRRIAVAALGELKDPKATDALTKAVSDTDRVTATTALNSLGQISSPQSTAALKKLAEQDDHPLRVSIAVAIHGLDKSGTQGRFAKLMGDKEAGIRREVIAAAAKLEGFDATDLYVSALKDSDTGVRKNSALALFKIETPSAQDALLEYVKPQVKALLPKLTGRDARVRSTALREVVNLGPAAAPILLDELEGMSSMSRSSVALAIGRLKNPAVITPVADRLKDTKLDANLRFSYEYVLRGCSDLARETIEELVTADEADVRVSGIRVMSSFRDDAAAKTFKASLTDSSDKVRCYAAAYLASLTKDEAALAVLKAGVKSSDVEARRMAISGLTRFDADTSLPTLLELAKGDDQSTLASVISALGMFKDKRATDAVVALAEKNPNLANSAIYGLQRQGTADAIRALGGFLKHDQTRIQQLAKSALQRSRSPLARRMLQQAADDAKKEKQNKQQKKTPSKAK